MTATGRSSTAYDSRTRAQIGYWGWNADYPAASDFLNVLFGRSSFEPASKINNNNPSEFADPAIDRQIDRALAEQTADPVTSQAAWARVDRLITDQAPVVALFNPKTIDAVSKRVGNHQYSGSGLGVLIDQLWVR